MGNLCPKLRLNKEGRCQKFQSEQITGANNLEIFMQENKKVRNERR